MSHEARHTPRYLPLLLCLLLAACNRPEGCKNAPGWHTRLLMDKQGNEYHVSHHVGCVWAVEKVQR